MVRTGEALKRPDKTGHFRTLGFRAAGRGAEALQKCLILSRGAAGAPNRGGIHFSKSCWPGLNAWSEREKNTGPLYIREFVALFCTESRYTMGVVILEVVD